MWVVTADLPMATSDPFYQRLNQLLREQGFDEFAEAQCAEFYAEKMGRSGLPPGVYFRLPLIGYSVAAVNDDAGAVIEEVVADKGYHSRTTVRDATIRSISRVRPAQRRGDPLGNLGKAAHSGKEEAGVCFDAREQ
jgi:hypothetical protein